MSDRLLTAKDVAERLAIGKSAAYELMHRLHPHVRIGQGKRTLIRLPESTLTRYIESEGDPCPTSTDATTRRIGGAGGTTPTASGGRSRRGTKAGARRRKLRELSKGSG